MEILSYHFNVKIPRSNFLISLWEAVTCWDLQRSSRVAPRENENIRIHGIFPQVLLAFSGQIYLKDLELAMPAGGPAHWFCVKIAIDCRGITVKRKIQALGATASLHKVKPMSRLSAGASVAVEGEPTVIPSISRTSTAARLAAAGLGLR